MLRRFSIVYCSLVIIQASAQVELMKDVSYLKEEFNICSLWHEGMTWKEFLKIRNELSREGLIKYVDKIEQQNLAKEAGLEVPKTYIASREKVPVVGLLSTLPSYVAKMTHLSLSKAIVIVKNGIDIINNRPMRPSSTQKHLFECFDESKPRPVESWALHHVKPGFMIQEYVANRNEANIQTVWGKAIVGDWRGGEPNASLTPVFGQFDRAGTTIKGNVKAPQWWSKAIAAAEKMAKGTDALRVDFLIKEDGQLLLSELEIWPETDWSLMKTELETALNDGYRKLCKQNRFKGA